MLRWGLIGCKAQSADILAAAIEANVPPCLVSTLDDRPDKEIKPLEDLAKHCHAEFLVTDAIELFLDKLKALDFIIVCRYPLLANPVLSAPRLGCLNVHSSLLPYYRGVHPVSWALIQGERFTGVSIHHIDHGIDTGAVVLQSKLTISEKHDIHSLTQDLNMLSAEMVASLLKNIKQLQMLPAGASQNTDNYFYARRRTPTDGKINWNLPLANIDCLVRGLQAPLPLAYSVTASGQQIDITRLEKPAGNIDSLLEPGTVLNKNGELYLIQCQDGAALVQTDAPLVIGQRLL